MVNDNDLEEILAQELERIKEREGKVNLAEVERRTGISRAILRRWQKNGYELKKGKRGRPSGKTKISGYEELINGLLSEGVTNSVVIRDRLMEQGYCGGLTIVKEYIGKHKDLVSGTVGEPGETVYDGTRGLLPDGLGVRGCRG